MNVVPAEVSYATNAMMVGEPYQGVVYSSLQLSGRSIAKPADSHGEGVLLPQLVTTYWPGGADGVPAETVATIDYIGAGNETDDEDPLAVDAARQLAHVIHRQIFGMGLANTTLTAGRFRSDLAARNAVDFDALGISHGQSVPLGGIAIARVVEHNQIRRGAYVANLYFPRRTTFPVFILHAIKMALPSNQRS
jgi:hypothetical protein